MKSAIIAMREINATLKERSFLLMILLELLLVSSSGLLSVGYVILTSPESSTTLSQLSSLIYVGVVTDTRQPFTQALTQGRVHHTFYDNFDVAYRDFKDGLIDAILVGDIRADDKPSVVTLYLPSNSPKTPLTKLALKRTLIGMEDSLRDVKVEEYAPKLPFATYKIINFKPQARYVEIYFIFTLPLLLFLPCIVSGSLAIDSLTQDMESKRMLNLIVAPLTPPQIVFGKALGSFVLSVLQSILWLIVMALTFINPENPVILIILCMLYTLIFLNIGSILALYLKKMKASQILYTFVSMSSISLFSPFANIHPIFLEFSPSYLITRLALGASPLAFAWQFTVIIALAALTSLLVMKSAKKINENQ